MKKAQKIHPKAYNALRDLIISVQSHSRLIENEKAIEFYSDVGFNKISNQSFNSST